MQASKINISIDIVLVAAKETSRWKNIAISCDVKVKQSHHRP
jgi:hypothetical protein